jgi:hypothetical protein
VPDQVTVTFCPAVEGTVTLLVGGVEAKLNMASTPPTEHRPTANTVRGLNIPDLEAEYFFMVIFAEMRNRNVRSLRARIVFTSRRGVVVLGDKGWIESRK